jgi:adenylate cyclase
MLALGAVAILTAAPLSLALVLVAFTAAGWLAFTLLAFQSGYWFSAALPLAAMAPAVAITTLGRQLLDRREAQRHEVAEAALRLFQPPGLVDRIAGDPCYLAEPQEQDAAVLFIDLSRFTRLSERLGPARTRELLRGFHALVEEETNATGGVVMSYMGDGAMMAFGLPEPKADDTGQALTAGFALLRRAREWIASLPVDHGADDIDVRIGAHFGRVVVSRLGAETHQHITITGDTVNVASRLLEVASAERAALVVSADLLATVGDSLPGRSAFRHLKVVEIRGRREPLWVGLWSSETPPPTGSPATDRFV